MHGVLTGLRTTATLALVSMALLAAPATAAASDPPDGATPAFEISVGFNGPQYRTAEFPGLTLSAAINLTETPTRGLAAIGEIDASYLRLGRMAGARIYRRTGPLYATRRSLAYFGQFLLGGVTGGESGVVSSQGGFAVQPGVGIDYGRGARAFHLQFDYRAVPGGFIDDARMPDEHAATLSGARVFLGLTWRFFPR